MDKEAYILVKTIGQNNTMILFSHPPIYLESTNPDLDSKLKPLNDVQEGLGSSA